MPKKRSRLASPPSVCRGSHLTGVIPDSKQNRGKSIQKDPGQKKDPVAHWITSAMATAPGTDYITLQRGSLPSQQAGPVLSDEEAARIIKKGHELLIRLRSPESSSPVEPSSPVVSPLGSQEMRLTPSDGEETIQHCKLVICFTAY